jgi:hypothetical protein
VVGLRLLDPRGGVCPADESEEVFVSDTDYYLDLINRLLASKDYDWARDTLEGIANTLASTGNLTPRQKAAVEHIMVGRLKHDVGPDGGYRQ